MKQDKAEIRWRGPSNRFAGVVGLLFVATISVAQEGLTIHNDTKQSSPSAEATRIYLSACAAVQREFGSSRELRPRVTLVLGTDKHKQGVDFDSREIRLAKWDRYMFAQG